MKKEKTYHSTLGLLGVHSPKVCQGPCPFHNPSDHLLNKGPIFIRVDRGCLVERICSHGVGHPDPDSVAWLTKVYGDRAWDVHGCCGCCFKEGGGFDE